MLEDLPGSSRKTVGADKNYDTAKFVAAAREMAITPHVAQNITGIAVRTSMPARLAIPATRSARSSASGSRRRTAGSRRLVAAAAKFRGLARVNWMFRFKAAAYNLVRLPRLLSTGCDAPKDAATLHPRLCSPAKCG